MPKLLSRKVSRQLSFKLVLTLAGESPGLRAVQQMIANIAIPQVHCQSSIIPPSAVFRKANILFLSARKKSYIKWKKKKKKALD